MSSSIKLMHRLMLVTERWLAEQRRTNSKISHATLASRAIGDGKLFNRLAADGAITVPVYERLVGFLAEARNWPAGLIPPDVVTVLVGLGCEVCFQAPSPELVGAAQA